MNWFKHTSIPSIQKGIFDATMQHTKQQLNYCMQDVQYELSPDMEKVMNVAGNVTFQNQ